MEQQAPIRGTAEGRRVVGQVNEWIRIRPGNLFQNEKYRVRTNNILTLYFYEIYHLCGVLGESVDFHPREAWVGAAYLGRRSIQAQVAGTGEAPRLRKSTA